MRLGTTCFTCLVCAGLCYLVASNGSAANNAATSPKQAEDSPAAVSQPDSAQPPAQDGAQGGSQDEAAALAEMMAQAAKYTQPGENHELLKKFLGDWDVEARLFSGGQALPPSKGKATCKWLIEGRWIMTETDSELMGMQNKTFTIMGYDNLKMSYVFTNVHSIDTAMTHAEGDMDPSGKVLLMYGTLDEYLTGEHDKMVKYVWRFNSDDEMVLEVHDLPIGETNTKVLEFKFTRAQ